MVVPGSQADGAGLQRGDIICFAGSNGQEEMMYNMFIEIAGSNHRPLEFDIRRIETKVSGDSGSNTSAEAYSRKQAVIAAAEAREKAAKKLEKSMVKRAPAAKKEEVDLNADLPDLPQSEEAYLAVQAAKQNESALAAKLGYNPYEANKSTAGQARSATVTTKHGDLATNTSGAPGSVPPPSAGTTVVDNEGSTASVAFQQAFEECVISNDTANTLSSFGVMRKLILNATTKGQMEGEESSKFRRVRLSNPKISTAIIEVHGALDLMLAVGFMLVEDDGESYLIYPPQDKGPSWLPSGLKQMQRYEGQK
jgi:PUB domain